MDDPELLAEFVVESQEHLSDVENQFLTLEAQGDNVDVALVNTVFRAVHSVKGAAGFLGLDVLQELAHHEEEVLNRLRNLELRPTGQVIDTLLKATDCLKGLLDEVDSSNDQDVSEHLTALKLVLDPNSATSAAESDTSTPSTDVQAAEGTSEESLKGEPASKPAPTELEQEALREFLVESHDNLEQLERDLMALESTPDSEDLINGVFRSIHTIKGTAGFLGFGKLERLTHVIENILGDIRSGTLSMLPELGGGFFQGLDKTRELLEAIEKTGSEDSCESEELATALSKLHEIVLPTEIVKERNAAAKKNATKKSEAKPAKKPAAVESDVDKPSAAQSPQPATTKPSVATETKPAAKPASGPAKDTAAAVPSASKTAAETSAADSTLRVDVSLLDRLMTCVGELVLTRNQILQVTGGQPDTELYRTSQRLNLITSELQESVMKTRMQPIGNVWGKFPRLVRDLGGICKKQVRVEMEGKETELDKTIIEAIKDPLTHLVRNTVDHGIESPETRVQVGKPAEGTLTLRAFHEGGQVNIEICDDGGGINAQKVRDKALERGLITQEQAAALPDRDAASLIFLPGFSTADQVSNVSGRGVGMDVVKTNIEKIGGTVDLQSEQGVGTTIKIKIPLTLAIIPALVATCGGDRYAIPQVNLLELLRLDSGQLEKEVEWLQSTPVYRLRGQLLPLVYLRDQLGLETPSKSDDLNIVVLRSENRQFGLVVDRIIDTEEIVVKPPSDHLKNIEVYSGTTIMGDGSVALILDVIGLSHSAGVTGGDKTIDSREASLDSQHALSGQESLLVARVGENHRYAVRLSQITRLENIDSSGIEWSENQPVIQYRGEILELHTLSEALGLESGKPGLTGQLSVLVYSLEDKTIGIVVDEIVDIAQHAIAPDEQLQRETEVIQGQITDVIDLETIFASEITSR